MKRLIRDHTVPFEKRYKVYEPAMTVDPGETVVVETVNHMTPVVGSESDLHPHGSPGYREREETGPIAVRGAEPGDMLAVAIDGIEIVGLPHAHGWGPLEDEYPQEPLLFPKEGGYCRLPGGIKVPLKPMVGDIYTTPIKTDPEYFDHGGNMDCTEVGPGCTLYLPVYREGGLLVLGDVHAAQGDGELYGEGLETAADVTVTLGVDRRFHAHRPVIEGPDSLMCLASRGSLFETVQLAVADMVALLKNAFGLNEKDAYVFCTTVGSLRVAGCLARKELAERSLLGLSVPKSPLIA